MMIAIATKRDKWINFDTITSRSKTNINICFESMHIIVKVRNSIKLTEFVGIKK